MWKFDASTPVITAEQKAATARAGVLAQYKAAFDAHLDAVAQAKQYDNRLTIADYKDSPNQQWAAEAQAFRAWKDLVALPYLFDQLAAAEAGGDVPTLEDFIGNVPPIDWP